MGELTHNLSKTLFALMVILLLSRAAPAALVFHSAAGTLINDGFESPDTVGGNPIGWTIGGIISPFVDVEDGSGAAPTPAAAGEGSQFLAMHANGNGGSNVTRSFAGGPYTSGTVTANFAFYVPSANDSNVFATFLNGSTGPLAVFGEDWIGFVNPNWITSDLVSTPVGSGGEVAYYDGANYHILTAGGTYNFSLNAWHVATMSYDIALAGATNALTIVIDGTTLDPLPTMNGLATGSVTGMKFDDNASGSGSGFVDAVPEPASMGVVLLGSLLLGYRRR